MSKTTEQKNTETSKGKVLSGVVVSNKMTDTVVVDVQSFNKHPKYHKFIKTNKKYKAHDAGNTLNIGDKVKIVETTPISKDKKFTLLEVVSKAPVFEDETSEEVTEDNA
jgi:small subunit ribosomal protein S17